MNVPVPPLLLFIFSIRSLKGGGYSKMPPNEFPP